MPATYTLIASNTLSSTAASVTFSAIPATYTDLLIKVSVRGSSSGGLFWAARFNGTSANYTNTTISGDGASARSDRNLSTSTVYSGVINNSLTLANTFTNAEMYIPSYLASQNKPIASTNAWENNTATLSVDAAYLGGYANLWSNTSAITDITVLINSGNFVSGSSFFLYGIKNS